MLEVINLSFDYHEKPLLTDLNFSVNPGQLLHLRGGNGAGKTTLLRLLTGLFHPLSGKICYQNQSIHDDLEAYQKNLCFIGHKSGINPLLTVKENIAFDLHYKDAVISIDELLEEAGLSQYTNQPCARLSAGEKRRVSLLRLYLVKKALWFLDEPLVALDQASIDRLMKQIKIHREKGGMVLLTSHQQLPLNASDYREYRL